ncbi:MAG: T9SS type A sorting domain-containing protein, partial [Bacteroidia bacterium]|nr:T9SS type A sorting domain-containing protein [Bacteroidia bacterium]
SILFSILFSNCVFSQSPEWAKQISGNEFEYIRGITHDSQDNIILYGEYSLVIDLDPGTSVLYDTSRGNSDIFIIKLDPNGNLIWAKTLGDSQWNYCMEIKCDGNDNVYLSGTFNDSIDIDPGPSVEMLDSTQGQTFLLKLNNNGEFVWAIQNGYSELSSFDIKSNNNLLLLDLRRIREIDENKNLISIDSIGGGGSYKILLDDNENIFVIGYFINTIDFDPDTGTYLLTSQNCCSFHDLYITKFDQSRNFLWATRIGSQPPSMRLKDAITDHSGNFYICFDANSGLCTGTNTTDTCFTPVTTSSGDFGYLLKYDPNGNFLNCEAMASNTASALAWGVTTDLFNNIYFTGKYGGAFDFDPGPSTYFLTSSTYGNVFIQKLDSTFAFIDCIEYAPTGLINSGKLIIDSQNNLYTEGYFQGSCLFDSSSGITFNSWVTVDSYVTKYRDIILKGNESVNSLSKQLIIFPNPSAEKISIKINELTGLIDKILIIDNFGSTIWSTEKYIFSNNDIIEIDNANLNQGIYTLVLISKNRIYSERFIKL